MNTIQHHTITPATAQDEAMYHLKQAAKLLKEAYGGRWGIVQNEVFNDNEKRAVYLVQQ